MLRAIFVIRDGFSGSYVWLNVWATWSALCRNGLPDLQGVQARLGGAQFHVIAPGNLFSVWRVDTVLYLDDDHNYIDESGFAMRRLGIFPISTTLFNSAGI